MYITQEFNFFRCVNVSDWVYGKTISALHAGNLRDNDNKGRYSKLFPNEKISYWADSKSTALSEIKKHGGNKNYLTFHAYDDLSSTFPTLINNQQLFIADGRELNFHTILLKIENDKKLTDEETKLVDLIKKEEPDCLAYQSIADKEGVNFLFFGKGFKKLALRKVQLYLGENKSKNNKSIHCAVSSDYMPIIESYGIYFEPVVKIKTDPTYKNTEEYQLRNTNYKNSRNRFRKK
ncbi:hypothetical protein AF088_14575 [Listeria monocytogenes]|nr:hypothetical protein [Listeria monocytogenes]ECH3702447.1 hypothetical protein [Listeria monocytogenes]